MADLQIEQLKAELRERDEFLAFLAHELRNPLHTLGLQLTSARLAVRSETGSASLCARIRKAELTLKRYTERMVLLLDLAQHNLGAFTVTPAPVELVPFLEGLIRLFDDEAEYQSARIVYRGPTAATLVTDLTAIEHIVSNLLTNALRYASATTIAVELAVDGAGGFEIAVQDDGCGIAEAQQAQIFDKFQRGSAVLTESGFGLGLWIVSQMAAALGGIVSLESRPGQGCRFSIRFPPSAPSPP